MEYEIKYEYENIVMGIIIDNKCENNIYMERPSMRNKGVSWYLCKFIKQHNIVN